MHPDLAALVGSRICHDLISPIGAISNGVELLSLTDGDTGAEMDLINQSVQSARARIKFFRIAYGAAGENQYVSRTEVVSILSATARSGRFNYIWQVEGDQPRRHVRCALLLVQALEVALPLGGDIHILKEEDIWVLRAEGPRMAVDMPLWDNLLVPDLAFQHTAAQVQFALLPLVAAESGRKISFHAAADLMEARF